MRSNVKSEFLRGPNASPSRRSFPAIDLVFSFVIPNLLNFATRELRLRLELPGTRVQAKCLQKAGNYSRIGKDSDQ
jgi:hypothetical protein